MDKLGVFYVNQTSKYHDPLKLRVRLACHETGLSPPLFFLLSIPRQYFFC